MKLLGKEGLLAKEKLEIKKVELDKDTFIFVKELTATEKDQLEQSMVTVDMNQKDKNKAVTTSLSNFKAKIVALSVCNEKGEPLLQFTDYKTLGDNMSSKRMEIIAEAAQSLNKITKEDQEEIIKN